MHDQRQPRRWARRSLAGASALALGAALVAVPGSAEPAHAAVDNPYAGADVYVNPDWSAAAEAGGAPAEVYDQPTFVWLDRIAAIESGSAGENTTGLEEHLDNAVAQDEANGSTPTVFQVVVYNLPGRDCAALASNGELGPEEIGRYKNDYVDVIADIIDQPKYSDLRIVTVIEPDSLPNLVTNAGSSAGSTELCRTMKENGNYVEGVGYSLATLGAIPNVHNYVDAAHHGWIGWEDNLQPTADIIYEAANAGGASPDDLHGFVTNTANYSALTEPHIDIDGTVGGQQIRQSDWVDWNQYNAELPFAQDFQQALVSAGFDSSIGGLIDTSRNGWGGPERPDGPSDSTDLNTYVEESRTDRRIHKGNWCNQPGGIGERPQVNPASGIDAYVWVKPPGESDGSSEPIENDEGKNFDEMCDPDYEGNDQNGNNPTGALADAPLAGHWFQDHFDLLLENAYPPVDGGGGPGEDTEAPSAPSGVQVTETTADSASLTWDAASDNVGVSGYTVYRDGSEVGTASGTSFTDTGLEPETSYAYTLEAFDAAGNTSPATDPVTATTQAGDPGGGDGGCTAEYSVQSEWGSGFVADVTVTNTGDAALDSWTVEWTWSGDQEVTQHWSADLAQSGTNVTASDLGWNGELAPDESASFGFQATGSASGAVSDLSCTAG